MDFADRLIAFCSGDMAWFSCNNDQRLSSLSKWNASMVLETTSCMNHYLEVMTTWNRATVFDNIGFNARWFFADLLIMTSTHNLHVNGLHIVLLGLIGKGYYRSSTNHAASPSVRQPGKHTRDSWTGLWTGLWTEIWDWYVFRWRPFPTQHRNEWARA